MTPESFSKRYAAFVKHINNITEKIGKENNLDQNALDRLANEMFGAAVQALNKLQASGLIDELLDRYGKGTQRGQYGRRYVGRNHSAVKGGNA